MKSTQHSRKRKKSLVRSSLKARSIQTTIYQNKVSKSADVEEESEFSKKMKRISDIKKEYQKLKGEAKTPSRSTIIIHNEKVNHKRQKIKVQNREDVSKSYDFRRTKQNENFNRRRKKVLKLRMGDLDNLINEKMKEKLKDREFAFSKRKQQYQTCIKSLMQQLNIYKEEKKETIKQVERMKKENRIINDKLKEAGRLDFLFETEKLREMNITQLTSILKTLYCTSTSIQNILANKTKEEHKIAISKNRCCICLTNQKNCLFEKCSHISTCMECSKKLIRCPICRVIGLKRKVFL